MSITVNRANMETLRDSAQAFVDAWDSVSDAVETWINFQDEQPTDADGREERKSAREEIDGGIDDIESAIRDLVSLLPKKDRAVLA